MESNDPQPEPQPEFDPELIAEIDAATDYVAVTSVELTDTRSTDHYPAVLSPWGTCHIIVDFDLDQLVWLEKAMSHAEDCRDCYSYLGHMAIMFMLGILGSARVTYPSMGFPTDVPLTPLASFEDEPDPDAIEKYILDLMFPKEGED